ncbi:flagellar biosynthetic protein FliR [Azospirillum fermentarium]|uniref:flagellar biosynthetic protein FliR n=1 Tax=Azospirillum fermentarium TaxID=1233114 RepID=UPI0022263261|nr:flagellar biosynthetic protein FliR [Azospirillum fermentarium]MCW2246492.1 flagellar biosynthetic protein FliR [Azospirillum fermentarium]
MNSILQAVIADQIYVWLMVFTRIGSAFMIMPAIGDTFVSSRTRLLLALAVSVLVAPVVRQNLPPEPQSALLLMVLMVEEITIGVFLGTVARLLMGALEVAGTIIATQSGLANAQMFNPAMATQGSLTGAMLGWLGLLLIFITDFHHLLIMAVVDSYTLFKPGTAMPVGDMADMVGKMVAHSFVVGVQMSTPFIITGMLFALALGLMNKLAPQVQVFFLFTSLQVALGLFLLALTLSAMMMFWLREFESTFIQFLNPG